MLQMNGTVVINGHLHRKFYSLSSVVPSLSFSRFKAPVMLL